MTLLLRIDTYLATVLTESLLSLHPSSRRPLGSYQPSAFLAFLLFCSADLPRILEKARHHNP